MELLEFAKWNIHVKEEPDILDSQQLLESQADSGARDESWMCMFPNDVPVNSDEFANSPCGELSENIEVSLLKTYVEGNPVSQEAYTSDISTITTANDERLDAITLLDQIFLEDTPNKEILPCEGSENRGQKETVREQELLLLQETAPKGQTQKRIDASSVGNELETTCSKYIEFEKKKNAVVKSKSHRSVEKPLCEEMQCVEVANSKETLLQKTGINEKNNNSSEIFIPDEATVNGYKVTRKRNADIGSPIIVEQSGFECPECGKMMRRFNGFVAHMKLHILHLKNSCVKCNICGMEFSSRELRMLHRKKCRRSRAPKLPCSNQNLEVNGNGKGGNAFENENALSQTQEEGNLMTSPTFTTNMLTTNNFKEAWFSQIKSSEDQKRESSKSIILSLRRFRFEKPKVVIEKMKLPLSRENTTTKLPSSLDVQLKGENQQEGETKLPSTLAAQQKSAINSLSLSKSINDCRIERNVGRSLNTEHSKLQSESNGNSKSLNDLSVIQSGVCETTGSFSTEDVERVPVLPQQSKLKIRIKPIVVLDRVGFLENLEDMTTLSQGGKLKVSASTSSNKKTQNESNQNFPALVKQFSLKKCFVKLSRLTDKDLKKYCVNDSIYRIPEEQNKERTCEKLKLLRTNSKVWKVTSAQSNRVNDDKITKDTPETIQKNSKTNNCRRRYHGTQKILSSHQKFAHVRTQTPKYKCCGCKATFHLLSELQLHVTKCSFSRIEKES